jgi:hypothetical protein
MVSLGIEEDRCFQVRNDNSVGNAEQATCIPERRVSMVDPISSGNHASILRDDVVRQSNSSVGRWYERVKARLQCVSRRVGEGLGAVAAMAFQFGLGETTVRCKDRGLQGDFSDGEDRRPKQGEGLVEEAEEEKRVESED